MPSNETRIPEDSVPGLREFRLRLRAGTLRIRIIMDDQFGVALYGTLLRVLAKHDDNIVFSCGHEPKGWQSGPTPAERAYSLRE